MLHENRSLIRLQAAFVRWRTRLLAAYLRKWVILGVLIGIVAGLGAIAFFQSIDWATQLFLGHIADLAPPLPRGEGNPVVVSAGRPWLLPLVTTLGGLISGFIVFTLAPEAEGHGTDAAIEAFHQRSGRIRGRIPLIKLVASAVTIGSGGSAGREGPTAQIAAGFGSWLGDAFQLSSQDRRIAVAVGVGSGIGAIFKAPLGGAILAAEILYVRDFELEALVPGFIASVIGYSIFATWAGWDPVFGTGLGLKFSDPQTLPWYAVLGVLAGLGGIAYVRVFYGVRDLFHRIRIPPHFKPAIGGLVVGLIALAFPQVLSMGYGWLQIAIEGNTAELALKSMLALVALKIIATSLTIGSGGSGGVFAPGLYIGGMLGGSTWWLLHGHVGWLPSSPAPFVIVGMMALFGGVAKAPIAVILMVAEMTNEFSMVVPAMLATTIAYLITGDTRIYESQVLTRGDSPAHRGEHAIPLIQSLTVGEAMRTAVVTLSPSDTIADARTQIEGYRLRGFPVVDQGRLVGIFTKTDLLTAAGDHAATVAAAMTREVVVAYPSETVLTALLRMTRSGISRLPVVEREHPDRLVGIIGTREVASALEAEVSAIAQRPSAIENAPRPDLLLSVAVREAMSTQIEAFPEDLPLAQAANRLAASQAHAVLLVDPEGNLVGIATTEDLERAIHSAEPRPTLGGVATRNVIVAYPDQSVAGALAQPGAEGLRQLPVVVETAGKRRPIGLLRRSDVLAAYLRARDRLARVSRRATAISAEHSGDVVVLHVAIADDAAVVGSRLVDLKLPRDAVITSVIRDGQVIIPRGQVSLRAGDQLQLLAASAVRDQVLSCLHGLAPENGAAADFAPEPDPTPR